MSFGKSWFKRCKLSQLLHKRLGMSESAAGWTVAAIVGLLALAGVWLLVLKIRGYGG